MSLAGARYRLIASGLADDIAAGRYVPGAHLPTEAELCRRFAASRFTVRQALAELKSRGQIASRPGIGTIVTAASPRRAFVETLANVEDVLRHGHAPFVVERVDEVIADETMAGWLGVHPGQAMLRIEGLRFNTLGRRKVPFAWGQVHVASAYAGIRDRLRRLDQPVAGLIAEMFGVMPARIDQEIEATAMPRHQARLLKAKAGAPALQVVRRYRVADGTVYEIARSIYPAGRFVYRNTLTSAR